MNDDERHHSQPGGGSTRLAGDFKLGFLSAGIPVVLLSLLSTFGNLDGSYGSPWYFLWYFGAAAFLLATGAMIVLFMNGRRNTAAGVLAALAVGLVALSATCFANLRGL